MRVDLTKMFKEFFTSKTQVSDTFLRLLKDRMPGASCIEMDANPGDDTVAVHVTCTNTGEIYTKDMTEMAMTDRPMSDVADLLALEFARKEPALTQPPMNYQLDTSSIFSYEPDIKTKVDQINENMQRVFGTATTTVSNTGAWTVMPSFPSTGLTPKPGIVELPKDQRRKFEGPVDPKDPLTGFYEVIDAYANGDIDKGEMRNLFKAWMKGMSFEGMGAESLAEIAELQGEVALDEGEAFEAEQDKEDVEGHLLMIKQAKEDLAAAEENPLYVSPYTGMYGSIPSASKIEIKSNPYLSDPNQWYLVGGSVISSTTG
jgi:hypothetical protein